MSIKANKISSPKALEHYIAVTAYKKQEKGEITLKAGMLVEVLEKTETGMLISIMHKKSEELGHLKTIAIIILEFFNSLVLTNNLQ